MQESNERYRVVDIKREPNKVHSSAYCIVKAAAPPFLYFNVLSSPFFFLNDLHLRSHNLRRISFSVGLRYQLFIIGLLQRTPVKLGIATRVCPDFPHLNPTFEWRVLVCDLNFHVVLSSTCKVPIRIRKVKIYLASCKIRDRLRRHLSFD